MTLQKLSAADISSIERLLRDIASSWPHTLEDQKQAKIYADYFVDEISERREIDRKRQVISNHFHQSFLHPAIRQMSVDRVNQTYDRLVEQGKIKEGEN